MLLRVLWWVYKKAATFAEAHQEKQERRHVVIVGASFGGLAVQRELAGRRDLSVTLVDFKEYFEYTPGVLRCLVQPSALRELTCPLPCARNELITATMVGATPSAVALLDTHGERRELPFDYLVLAVGSTYAEPIKPVASEPTLAERKSTWADAASKLRAAASVVVVGAGAVGVELAGEILTVYPSKHVIVVDVAATILPGFDEAARAHALAWLECAGAELMLGEAIEAIEARSVLLKSGHEITADVIYKCVGVMPNTGMLRRTSFAGTGFRESVEVNDQLQVAGQPRVYAVGDMMSHASRELKLGHTAEMNGHLAAHNILADAHGAPLRTYPHGVSGAATSPKIYCLSLGKYDAVMGFNGLVLTGSMVAVLKWLLEWTKVAAAAERPVGILFWRVADAVSNWMSRTILTAPNVAAAKAVAAATALDTDDTQPALGGTHIAFPHPALDFLKYPMFADLGMLLLRVVTASLIIHHGLDKLEHTAGFSNGVIATYFPFLPGPPLFWTYLSAGFEIVGSFCITVGIFVRPAAALLAGTMLNALAFHLMKFGRQSFPFNPPSRGAYTFEPCLAFLAVTAYLALAGPGRFACRPNGF